RRSHDAQAAHAASGGARRRGGAAHGSAQDRPAAGRRRPWRAARRAQHARPLPRQSHLAAMQFLATDALARARRVRMVIFDVDGVLTDGRLWYGPGGEELKAFHAFDGHGVKLLQLAGFKTALISGRDSQAVSERA